MQFQCVSGGQVISVEKSLELFRGGEGSIYALAQSQQLVAKIYHRPTDEHSKKLSAMVANPPDDPMASTGHTSIAWPVDLLRTTDPQAKIVGFLMNRVSGMRPLHDLYNPKTRRQISPKFNYLYLHRAARNIAIGLHALHDRNYVVGDINESNILVRDTALVTFVDTDSFQVRDPSTGAIWRCPVGKPEYTPPELQGQSYSKVDRSLEHDLFGLAVLIFMLLMEGNHPFAGSYLRSGEPKPLEARIALGQFPYARAAQVPYSPPKLAPPFSILDPALQGLVLRCFEDGYTNPKARPDTTEWMRKLEQAENNLITCTNNIEHRYGKHLASCPWCERTKLLGGRDPFSAHPLPTPRPPRRSRTTQVPLPPLGGYPPTQGSPPPPPPRQTPPLPTPLTPALSKRLLKTIGIACLAGLVLWGVIALASSNNPSEPPSDGSPTSVHPDDAVDNLQLGFDTYGDAEWLGQTTTYYYGGDAARSGTITDNEETWLRGMAVGPGILTFYWKVSSESNFDFLAFYIDGVEQASISGSVDWHQKTYSITSDAHAVEWRYAKDDSGSSGADCGWLDKVEFTSPPPTTTTSLGEAVDNSALTWTTGGSAEWFGQTTTSYYGGDAAQSGDITDDQAAWLRTTVTGPGTLTFYWKVSSGGPDYLGFYINGIQQTQINGNTDWHQQSYSVGTGTYTLEWSYSKDGSGSYNSDCGWLDKVEFTSTDATALADLVVTDLTWSPASPSVGDTVTCTATIKNQGSVSSTTCRVAFYVNDAIVADEAELAGLQTGVTGTVTQTWANPLGGHTIKAKADYDNDVPESNETNNEKTVSYGSAGLPNLGEAVDNVALTWATDDSAEWFGQTTTSYYGGDAVQSGDITHSKSTWLNTTVTGPGMLTFYWKVSSQADGYWGNYDYLRFYVNGIEQAHIAGSVDWEQKSYSLTSGTYTLKWEYAKDSSVDVGSDCGWVDKVEFTSGPSITVTYPNGGENWGIGSNQAITWTSSGVTGNVHISISRNGGASWDDFIRNTDNDGSESWTVTGPATTQTRIRVISASDGSIWGESNGNFIIY